MHKRNFLKFMGVALLCPVCADIARAQEDKHWTYEGNEGPANWSKIDSSFESCSIGKQQSPINISGPIDAKLPRLNLSYRTTVSRVRNNGHTIQANLVQGATLKVGDETYDLAQFHFHRPSEHLIDGKSFPMEVHFVHRNTRGQLGIIGVMMIEGAPNAAFAKIVEIMPKEGGKQIRGGLEEIDFTTLLPSGRNYYSYSGSLTTPPCSEQVAWMLLTDYISVAASDVAAFAKLFPNNARPAQKILERAVKRSS